MRFHMLVAFLAFASAVLAADLQSQVHGASECGELEQVHGASTVNNWMLITTPLLPANYTPTQICTEGLNCKRLLRPLMTSDDRYQLACPNDCSGNGVCCGGVCACNAGYRGLDCSVERCPGKCSGKGECKLGKCFCEPGFSGDNCEKSLSCPQFAGKECAGHGTCHRGKCFCDPGFTNEKCSQVSKCPNDCHNRGFCLHGMCFCPPGYGGRDCGTELAAATCLNDCSGKGECVRGKCQCYPGHYGSDCSKIVRCPKGANGRICSGLGSCHNGKCECDEGRHGFACSLVQDCPGNGTCSGRGLCLRGTCYCYPGSEGSACERNSPCASGCNGNGVCVEGKCHCLPGYFGADCAKATPWAEYYRLKKCPRFTVPVPVPASIDANGTIKLLVNVSETVPTPNTTACELDQDTIRSMIKLGSPCPNACSGTGVCLNGTCACLPGHAGIDCSEVAEPLKCPNSCSYRGVCVFGRCSCMPPYKGADCSETDDPEAQKALQSRTCPKNCRGRGKCVRGRCICDPGYAGHDCALDIPCKDNCNGRGRCDRGRCFCFPGFEGASCGKVSRCPGGCSAHGQCFYGKCFCDPYYAGEDCSATPTCTKGCHAEHGICRGEDLCVCEPGWTGVSCSEKLQCPKDCSGFDHGVCTATEKGVKCICKPGWIGEDCAKAWDDCPNKCSGKGKCDMGQCRCDPGFTGLDCSAAAGGSALAALTANLASQQTRSNSSAAQPRFRAVTSAELLSRTQSGQEMAARAEASSTTSLASSMRLRSMSMVTAGACPNGCSGKGVCREGVCFCDPGQTGPDCAQVIECPDNCSGNGICQYGRCYCDPNHAGTNCSLKSNTRRTFPQPWVTAILCCVFFFIGMIVGRKSLKYSIEQELKLTDELPSSGTIAQVRA